MKYYNYLSLVTLFLVMGCNSENVDEEHHYDNKLYITSATITDDLLIKADVKEATRSLSYRLASPANQKYLHHVRCCSGINSFVQHEL